MAAITDPELISQLEALSQGSPETVEARMGQIGKETLRAKGEPTEGPSPRQQVLHGLVSGGIAALPMLIPGGQGGTLATLLRLAAEPIAGMAGEYTSQKAGFAPKSGPDIFAAGVMPFAARAGLALPTMVRGGLRGGAGLMAPLATREAGIDLAQDFLAGPSSKTAFEAARKQGGAVPVVPIIDSISSSITKETGMAIKSRKALIQMKEFRSKYTNKGLQDLQGPGSVSYGEVIDDVQRLRQATNEEFKAGHNVTGSAMSRATKEMLDVLDKISPLARQANAAYRNEAALETVTQELRKPNAGAAIKDLLKFDSLVAGHFTPQQKVWLQEMATRMSNISANPTLGFANRMFLAISEAGAGSLDEPLAKDLLKLLMQNKRVPLLINRQKFVVGNQVLRSLTRDQMRQPNDE